MPIKLENIQPSSRQSSSSKEGSKKESIWTKDIQLLSRGLSPQQKEAFYLEMATLLKAGLDIRKSLELQVENAEKAIQKETFESLLDTLLGGSSLAEAMDQAGQFSVYEISGVRIAEESGRLSDVLIRLATHFSKVVKLNRLLISTLSYPILVIVVALGAVAFLITFLVPLFGEIYLRLNQELPAVTTGIINLSKGIQSYGISLLIGILLIIGLLYFFRKKDWFRKLSSNLILQLPIIGKTFKLLQLSRFCHSLGFLLNANVPLVNSLRLTKKMVTFYPIQQAADQLAERITTGVPLHQALQKYPIFPRKLVALLRVSEETNQMGPILLQIGNNYDEEVEQQTKLLGSLIEPVLIVFLALIVGVILVAMYLPIFKLVTNFGL